MSRSVELNSELDVMKEHSFSPSREPWTIANEKATQVLQQQPIVDWEKEKDLLAQLADIKQLDPSHTVHTEQQIEKITRLYHALLKEKHPSLFKESQLFKSIYELAKSDHADYCLSELKKRGVKFKLKNEHTLHAISIGNDVLIQVENDLSPNIACPGRLVDMAQSLDFRDRRIAVIEAKAGRYGIECHNCHGYVWNKILGTNWGEEITKSALENLSDLSQSMLSEENKKALSVGAAAEQMLSFSLAASGFHQMNKQDKPHVGDPVIVKGITLFGNAILYKHSAIVNRVQDKKIAEIRQKLGSSRPYVDQTPEDFASTWTTSHEFLRNDQIEIWSKY